MLDLIAKYNTAQNLFHHATVTASRVCTCKLIRAHDC